MVTTSEGSIVQKMSITSKAKPYFFMSVCIYQHICINYIITKLFQTYSDVNLLRTQSNKLVLNVEKIITNKYLSENDFSVHIYVELIRYLGIFLDWDLNFHEQINTICSKKFEGTRSFKPLQ